jgi:hypothetical protein
MIMLISTSSERRIAPELGKVVACLDRYARSMGKVNGALVRTDLKAICEVSTRLCEGGLRITCMLFILLSAV